MNSPKKLSISQVLSVLQQVALVSEAKDYEHARNVAKEELLRLVLASIPEPYGEPTCTERIIVNDYKAEVEQSLTKLFRGES